MLGLLPGQYYIVPKHLLIHVGDKKYKSER